MGGGIGSSKDCAHLHPTSPVPLLRRAREVCLQTGMYRLSVNSLAASLATGVLPVLWQRCPLRSPRAACKPT